MHIPSLRSLASSFLALSLTGAMASATTPAAEVTEDIKGGAASLTLTQTITVALAVAQIEFIKVSPGTVSKLKGTVSVPITGGALDTTTATLEVSSGGGFKFAKGTQEVSAIDYIATISGGQGTVSALITVNGVLQGRTDVATFPVTIPTPVTIPANKKIKLQNLSLTLSSAAATALNSAFGTNAFSSGQDLGSYNIVAILAPKTL